MRTGWLTAIFCTLIVTAGCGTSSPNGPDKPDYTPVPDQDLFAQVEQIDGVIGSDVSYNGDFPDKTYVGQVQIEPGADAQQVLDEVHAVLRQGRYDVDMNIEGRQDDQVVAFDRLPGSGVGTTVNLLERYGPQPGDGKPPAD